MALCSGAVNRSIPARNRPATVAPNAAYKPEHASILIMEMIAHQAIGMHLPVGFGASLAHRTQDPLPVFVVPEDVLPLVPPVHDVIHGPRMLNAQLARHRPPLPTRPGSANSEDLHAAALRHPAW